MVFKTKTTTKKPINPHLVSPGGRGEATCLVSTVHVMVWRMFPWQTLGLLIPKEHCFCSPQLIWGLLLTMCIHPWPSFTIISWLLQHDDARNSHVVNMRLSSMFLGGLHLQQFPTEFKRTFKDVAEWEISQQEYVAIEWFISKECFQHLVESMPWTFESVVWAKSRES